MIFRGHVQGVYFRAHCAEKAESLGLDGYVQNLPDGSVEAVFEGDRSVIEACIEWNRRSRGRRREATRKGSTCDTRDTGTSALEARHSRNSMRYVCSGRSLWIRHASSSLRTPLSSQARVFRGTVAGPSTAPGRRGSSM